MSEESSVREPTGRQSVKSYASKVFKESSVTAVSAILSTGSIPRKIFRLLVFALFTVGFLYQCIKFLLYVLTFPTVVTVEIRKPGSYLDPAYTFCNHNNIKRSKFCAKYPDECITPNTEFCDKYPKICKGNDTKIIKEECDLEHYYRIEDEILEFSHDLNDLLVNNMRMLEKPEGPFIRYRMEHDYSGVGSCYSYRGRVDSSLDLHERVKYPMKWLLHRSDEMFVFDSEENEIFCPYSKSGVFFAIHSQFDAVNPFKKGLFLKPGYYYQITVSMLEEKLMEHPYQTDCINYTEKWLNNNKRGPRSQDMCQELCMVELMAMCQNCTSKRFNYPSQHKFCDEGSVTPSTFCIYSDESEAIRLFKECFNNCKNECFRTKYEYKVQEREIEPMFYLEDGFISKNSRLIQVYIEFEDQEIYSFEHKAQYQEVEAFSYIGGFIGIWLGISLVEIADFFESGFRIARYFFRKGSVKCCRSSNSV